MKNTTKDYFTIGVEKFNIGDFKRAMEYFQAAIEQNPYLEQAYLKLAEVYLSLKDERNAKKILYRLLSIIQTIVMHKNCCVHLPKVQVSV